MRAYGTIVSVPDVAAGEVIVAGSNVAVAVKVSVTKIAMNRQLAYFGAIE